MSVKFADTLEKFREIETRREEEAAGSSSRKHSGKTSQHTSRRRERAATTGGESAAHGSRSSSRSSSNINNRSSSGQSKKDKQDRNSSSKHSSSQVNNKKDKKVDQEDDPRREPLRASGRSRSFEKTSSRDNHRGRGREQRSGGGDKLGEAEGGREGHRSSRSAVRGSRDNHRERASSKKGRSKSRSKSRGRATHGGKVLSSDALGDLDQLAGAASSPSLVERQQRAAATAPVSAAAPVRPGPDVPPLALDSSGGAGASERRLRRSLSPRTKKSVGKLRSAQFADSDSEEDNGMRAADWRTALSPDDEEEGGEVDMMEFLRTNRPPSKPESGGEGPISPRAPVLPANPTGAQYKEYVRLKAEWEARAQAPASNEGGAPFQELAAAAKSALLSPRSDNERGLLPRSNSERSISPRASDLIVQQAAADLAEMARLASPASGRSSQTGSPASSKSGRSGASRSKSFRHLSTSDKQNSDPAGLKHSKSRSSSSRDLRGSPSRGKTRVTVRRAGKKSSSTAELDSLTDMAAAANLSVSDLPDDGAADRPATPPSSRNVERPSAGLDDIPPPMGPSTSQDRVSGGEVSRISPKRVPDAVDILLATAVEQCVSLVAKAKSLGESASSVDLSKTVVPNGKRLLLNGKTLQEAVVVFRTTLDVKPVVPLIREINEAGRALVEGLIPHLPEDSPAGVELDSISRKIAGTLSACVIHFKNIMAKGLPESAATGQPPASGEPSSTGVVKRQTSKAPGLAVVKAASDADAKRRAMARIAKLVDGSDAQKAGLRVGDEVLVFGDSGFYLEDEAELRFSKSTQRRISSIVKGIPEGERLRIVIRRKTSSDSKAALEYSWNMSSAVLGLVLEKPLAPGIDDGKGSLATGEVTSSTPLAVRQKSEKSGSGESESPYHYFKSSSPPPQSPPQRAEPTFRADGKGLTRTSSDRIRAEAVEVGEDETSPEHLRKDVLMRIPLRGSTNVESGGQESKNQTIRSPRTVALSSGVEKDPTILPNAERKSEMQVEKTAARSLSARAPERQPSAELRAEMTELNDTLISTLHDLDKARASQADTMLRLERAEEEISLLKKELAKREKQVQVMQEDFEELQQFVLFPQYAPTQRGFEIPDFEKFESSYVVEKKSSFPELAAVEKKSGSATNSPRDTRRPLQQHAAQHGMVQKAVSVEEKDLRRKSLNHDDVVAAVSTKDVYYDFSVPDTDNVVQYAAPPPSARNARNLNKSANQARGKGRRKSFMQRLPNEMSVQVIAGRNLTACEQGLSNPFVLTRVIPAIMPVESPSVENIRGRKTKIAKRTLNPLWNDTYELSFGSPQSDSLHFSVCHWNLATSEAVPIGRQVVHLAGFPLGVPVTRWISLLGGKGEIGVEILIANNSLGESSRSLVAKRTLVAATQTKLLDLMLPPEKGDRDANLVLDWCLSYRAVMSPEEFFRALVERYKGPDPSAKYSDSAKFLRTLRGVQNSVGYVFHTWLTQTKDFHLNHKLQHKLERFLRDCQPPTAYVDQCLQFFEEMHTKRERETQSERSKDSSRSKSSSSTPRGGRSVRDSMSSRLLHSAELKDQVDTPLTVDDLTAKEMADQLTLMEFEMARQLSDNSHEFMRQSWNKKGAEEEAPNILGYIDWFNQSSLWFQTLILQCEDKQARAVMIAKLVKVAARFIEFNNFNGVMEIATALFSSAVSRLRSTWAILPKEVVEEFDIHSQLMSPEGNYKQYRAALSRALGTNCVPYVGVWLTDLTFIDDANPDFLETDSVDLEAEPMINFEKMSMLAQRMRELRTAVETALGIQPSLDIRHALMNSMAGAWLDADLFRISLLREPRRRSASGGEISTDAEDEDDYGNERFDSKTFAKISAQVMKRGTGRNFVDTNATPLTNRDWKLLLTTAELVNRKKDDVIVQQGSRNDFIFRMQRGTCRVEKSAEDDDGKVKTVVLPTTLKPPSMFGEMSVLGDFGIASASVVSNDDRTMVYEIEMSFIEGLFATEPGLCMRFFNYAAHKLADMLVTMGGGPKKRESPKKLTRHASQRDSRSDEGRVLVRTESAKREFKEAGTGAAEVDLFVQEKFGTDANDLVLKLYKCGLKKRLLYNGSLYVTQRHLCFTARNFGGKAKERVAFKDIKQIQSLEDTKVLVYMSNKNKLRFVFSDKDECQICYQFIQRIWQRRNIRGVQSVPADRTLTLDEADEQNRANDTFSVLPATDWETLLRGAKSVTVPKGETIIAQGQNYQRLYQISRGRCRIELDKGAEGGRIPIGKMEQGELFGEISFVRGAGASATVIADSDSVDLTIIEGYFVNALFNIDPSFAGRFYKYLAALLAYRIRLRGK